MICNIIKADLDIDFLRDKLKDAADNQQAYSNR